MSQSERESTEHPTENVGLPKGLRDSRLSPEEALIANETLHDLEIGISRLSEEDREIIRLRDFESRTNQGVANSLGLTNQAASMRYLRAKRRLKTILLAMSEHGN
jgi:RNA polymerase sigma-70 factor (ECF subfamily)